MRRMLFSRLKMISELCPTIDPTVDAIGDSQTPKFAVCVAAYNGMQWLPEQLHSIFDQVRVKVTVFVSVDISIDGTEAWVDEQARNNSSLIVLPHGKKFGSAGQNFFRLLMSRDFSEFDYVALSDQDDIWLPEKLERAHRQMILLAAEGYSSNVTAFWTSGERRLIQKAQAQRKFDFLFEAAGPGCTYVLTKKLISGLQEKLETCESNLHRIALHDWFIYAFARANGFKWFIDDYSSLLYRQHNTNLFGANRGWLAYLKRAKMILNGWWLDQARTTAVLCGAADLPFVQTWLSRPRLGIVWLALNANQCRRRLRDRILFFCACLLVAATRRSRTLI